MVDIKQQENMKIEIMKHCGHQYIDRPKKKRLQSSLDCSLLIVNFFIPSAQAIILDSDERDSDPF